MGRFPNHDLPRQARNHTSRCAFCNDHEDAVEHVRWGARLRESLSAPCAPGEALRNAPAPPRRIYGAERAADTAWDELVLAFLGGDRVALVEAPMRPARNVRYLAFIRTLPCAVCGTRRNIEAAHTGPHGLGQKAPDSSAIPLCVKHHRTGSESYHKLGRRFAQYHRIDIQAIVRKLNAKPRINVIAGSFVADMGEDTYKLGPVQEGLDRALRKLEKIRFEHHTEALV